MALLELGCDPFFERAKAHGPGLGRVDRQHVVLFRGTKVFYLAGEGFVELIREWL